MAELYSVQRAEASVPVAEYLEKCVDVEKFLGFCRQCENFDKRWSCPSFDFAPLEVWRRFKTLRLRAAALTPLPGAALADLMAGLWQEKEKMLAELWAAEEHRPGSLALSAGSCKLCAQCTRPQGLPCRQPERMRYSIEALGGDVGKTAELYFQKPLQWIKDGEMPEYLTLIGGLLLPE